MKKCKRCQMPIDFGVYCDFCRDMVEFEKMENPREQNQRSDLI